MSKWVYRGVAALGLLLTVLAAAVLWTAQRTERPVGFDVGRGTNSLGRAFAIAIWYPTTDTPWPTTPLGVTLISVARGGAVDGQRLPLIVISHGNGGGPGSHVDLAMVLANSGYVVAAPMHAGDNVEDGSGLSSPRFWSNRSHEIRATIDYMLNDWVGHTRLDSSRIAGFGFSAGGFTMLTAVGGRPDLRVVASRCSGAREFVCEVLSASKSPLLQESVQAIDQEFVADARIKAAVVAAPGLGFTFEKGGLNDVAVPVQLWTGDKDQAAPTASNGAIIARELGNKLDARSVAGAGHASFLAPCGLLRPPALCADEGSFDRAAFHKSMNAEVVDFFSRTLR